ncbi:MAG: hypothetical protein B6229_07365 [Spirochaetaceae bacterium 4572_7]|nr:MAG: hypothetical protein B6229_07365 [Spirochaetaceae bacterium 4572_7]
MKNRLQETLIDLIRIDSVSKNSNKKIIEYLSTILSNAQFELELLKYIDPAGIEKYNLIAHKGTSPGGLAFLCHSDTVPLATKEQLNPTITDGKIYGRGACDMKGPMAAAIWAGVDSESNLPLTYIITADEEIGCEGAEYVVKNSKLLKKYSPQYSIATEPTELKPIYAHKGLGSITVTANGTAAHSSTEKGVNANFKIAPFLYFISTLREKYNSNKSYQNSEFTPPTNGLNMVISDFNCALNITAARSRCSVSFRSMPNARTEDILEEITDAANRLGLTITSKLYDSLYTDPHNNFVKYVEDITKSKAGTVPYLTDAFHFKANNPIILGPGSINQAHTENEYIDIKELNRGYSIYKQIIKNPI